MYMNRYVTSDIAGKRWVVNFSNFCKRSELLLIISCQWSEYRPLFWWELSLKQTLKSTCTRYVVYTSLSKSGLNLNILTVYSMFFSAFSFFLIWIELFMRLKSTWGYKMKKRREKHFLLRRWLITCPEKQPSEFQD